MRIARFALALAAVTLLAGTASAQGYYDPGGYEPPPDQGGGYDPAGTPDPNQGQPGYGQPAQPQPQPQPQPAASFSASTDAAGEGISGFELGINWAGGTKLAIQPGWLFGRVGVYLLFGLDYVRFHEEAHTDDYVLNDPLDPTAGATHHGAYETWEEDVSIDTSGVTYDIGLALRIYLLEELQAQRPDLYLELGFGWRGAALGTDIKWNYSGAEDAFLVSEGDVNGDGDLDEDDIAAAEYAFNKLWNKTAADINDDTEELLDGLWWYLGVGGEYVFTGGFGIAGEAGLAFFYNTKWSQKAPFGYDDDGNPDEFDWEYERVDESGWELHLGFYYNVALRYHF